MQVLFAERSRKKEIMENVIEFLKNTIIFL